MANELEDKAMFTGALGSTRTYTGEHLSQVAFPLGGIGTGTVSLSGTGRLIDWEIFRRPAKGRDLPCFFALRVSRDSSEPMVRILERECLPPFSSISTISASHLNGVPRFREARFQGEYPIAWLSFEDEDFPVEVALETFNPLIPLDVENSSIPVAILNWKITNPSDLPVDLNLLAGMRNPIGSQTIGTGSEELPQRVRRYKEDEGVKGVLFDAPNWRASHDPNTGSVMLGTTAELDQVQLFGHSPRQHGFEYLWRTFMESGTLEDDREYLSRQPKPDTWTEDWPCKWGEYRPDWDHPSLMTVRRRLGPRETCTLPFFITWHFPYTMAWTDQVVVRTHVARQFRDAWHVAQHVSQHLAHLTVSTREFHSALFSSTLPPEVIEAASVQAAAFRTAASVHLADGTLYGYEGVGGAYGSCTHVWNPEAVGAFAFPSLEQSMRRVEFGASMDPSGAMNSRAAMPSVLRWDPGGPFLAADGHMGAIIRAYREWQLSGDEGFLRDVWPGIRRAVEFAWSPENDMCWDADRDGVMEGCQSTTYDMPLLGPNPLCTILYIGALEAAARMAEHLNEANIARGYREVAGRGREGLTARLWNGEYFIQEIMAAPGLVVPEFLPEVPPFDPEREAPNDPPPEDRFRFQIGRGCMSEQLLGQYLASMSGLGDLIDRDKILSTLQSIIRYNFRHQARKASHVERAFAVNDEPALLLCSWPHGGEPRTKVYNSEAWTGVEYHVAATLISYDLVDEGLQLVRAVRSRHDGRKRNPWDEIESGHQYVRAMAGWALLPALCGFTWSAVTRQLSLFPRIHAENFRSFFSTPQAYGEIHQTIRDGKATLEIRPVRGSLHLKELTWTVALEGLKDVQPLRGGWDVAVANEPGKSLLRITFSPEHVVSASSPLAVNMVGDNN